MMLFYTFVNKKQVFFLSLRFVHLFTRCFSVHLVFHPRRGGFSKYSAHLMQKQDSVAKSTREVRETVLNQSRAISGIIIKLDHRRVWINNVEVYLMAGRERGLTLTQVCTLRFPGASDRACSAKQARFINQMSPCGSTLDFVHMLQLSNTPNEF